MPKPKISDSSPKFRLSDSTPVAVRNLGKWLRECLYLVKDEEGSRFNRVVCRQLVKGNKRGEEVFFMDVPKKAKDEWTDTAAQDIYGRLMAEASTLGGLQKYALYAYHSDDNENHTTRFVLRIQGADDDDEGEGLDSEGPDKAGLTSQAMRHAEIYAKINTGAQMTLLSTYQGLVGRLSTMVEKLMDARLSSIDAIEELIQRKQDHEVNMIQAQAKAQGIKAISEKLGLLLPAVANKMAGQQLFPVQANAVMMMVKGLATSIASNEDKMKALMGILSPEEALAFMNVLEEVSKNVGENGLPSDGKNGAMVTHNRE